LVKEVCWTIHYAKSAVQLSKEDGDLVEFLATIQINQTGMLSQLKGTSFEEMKVVQEYP
jgi:hypothetical protein